MKKLVSLTLLSIIGAVGSAQAATEDFTVTMPFSPNASMAGVTSQQWFPEIPNITCTSSLQKGDGSLDIKIQGQNLVNAVFYVGTTLQLGPIYGMPDSTGYTYTFTGVWHATPGHVSQQVLLTCSN